MRFPSLLVAGLLLFALRPSSAAAAPIKVACVGDSITQNSGWSDKLGAKLGAGYTSTNYGVSGTTLLKNGDSSYWKTAQFTQSHSANPDIVVIMLGTNDSKPFNWNAHKGEFVSDYEALVDSYAALPSHPKIYLNLCPPAGTNGFQIVGSVIENEVNPDVKQVAAARGLPTIDVFTAFGGHNFDPSLFGSAGDQVHPNGKGAQVIADTVYAALVAVGADGGTDAAGAKDGGADGAGGSKADASSGLDARDASSTGGAGGTGAAGASGAAGGAGAGGGATAGTSGAAGVAGGGAGTTGAAGASSAGTSGAGSTGAAGTSPRSHVSGGGCAIAARTGDSPWAFAVALVLGLIGARRRRR